MAHIKEIDIKKERCFVPKKLNWLQKAIGGFTKGGVYLVAGDPGIGKTTLSLQILIDLARQKIKVLYITSEQSLGDLKMVFDRVWPTQKNHRAVVEQYLCLDDSTNIPGVDSLRDFLLRKVLASDGPYLGTEVIVLDSLQGFGLTPQSIRMLDSLSIYAKEAKAAGITTIIIGHVTKEGKIAGAKRLEHLVDVVFLIRRAMRFRPLFIPKNRFGPAILSPIILEMDKGGALVESPHTKAEVAKVWGYTGRGDLIADIQAIVTFPEWGFSPTQNIPALNKKQAHQLLHILSTIPGVDLSKLSFEIQVFLPEAALYHPALSLPIGIAVLSSYLQQTVTPNSLFVGELDLMHNIRTPDNGYLENLAIFLASPEGLKVKKIYLSAESITNIKRLLKNKPAPDFQAVDNLPALLNILWPNIRE